MSFTLERRGQASSDARPCSCPDAMPAQLRLAFLDWLRLMLVAAVVLHSCVAQLAPDAAYSWGVYYAAGPSAGLVTRLAFAFLITLLQSHVWALLYLVSGFLTPGSYTRKGPLQFVLDKSARLLLPLAAWELLLRPACFYLAHASGFGLPAGLPQPPRQQVLHGSAVIWLYRWYFGWYRAVGESHMWFVALLFLLQVGYAGLQQAHELCMRHPWVQALFESGESPQPFMTRNVRRQMRRSQQLQQQLAAQSPYYSNRGTAVVLAVLSACLVAVMFLVLGVAQFDWSLYIVNVQYCAVFQHGAAFCVGVALQHHPKVLSKLRPAFCYRCMALGLCVFVAGWLPDTLSLETDLFPTWLDESITLWNLLFAAYTQIFAVLWSVGLLVLLQRACSQLQPPAADRSAGCSRERFVQLSYGVFVLHPMVLVIFSLVSSLRPLMFVCVAFVVVSVGSCLAAAAVRYLLASLSQPAFRAAVSALSREWLPDGKVKQLLQGAEHVL